MASIVRTPCDEALIRHGSPGLACGRATKRWVLVAAIVGSSMAFVDATVVNVALPSIQRDLDATAFQLQWVVESYALFLAALLLLGGALGDRYGRRTVFVVGVALFAVASVGCALSGTVRQLIAARALQGVGAALLVPGSLALISASFPEHERGPAIGTWAGFSGLTAALGPVLGGLLVDRYSWTWAFLLNAPLAIVVIAIAWARVPESRGDDRSRLDVAGGLWATVALTGIVFALIEAPTRRWTSPAVLAALAGGVVAALLFLRHEARTAAPMLPLALFRNRNFSGANLLTLLLYAALGGGLYFFPLNLIQVQGYSATAAGAALLPFIGLMFVLSRWAGRLVDRVGPKLPLTLGPAIAAAAFAAFAIPGIGGRYWTTFFPAVLLLGLGMAITVAPLTTTVMNSVGPERAGTASGVNNAVSRVGGVLAVAAFGLVMAWRFDGSLGGALDALGASPPLRGFLDAQRSKLAEAALPPNLDAATAAAVQHALHSAYVAGFRLVMLLSAGLSILSSLVAAVFIEGRPRG